MDVRTEQKERHVVTGAFGYTGKYIARRLLEAGYEVRTLTNSPQRKNPFNGRIKPFPYNFDNPSALRESLRGTTVLYNNYWVRFNYGDFNHSVAVDNTLRLFEAAKAAGVRRIVHVSITNPSEDSPFEYFRGKAKLEQALKELGVSYAILRPTVIFGKEDILVNNIAWMLRHFPVFGVFGDGKYRMQPIYVEDLAKLATEQGERGGNVVIDAIGPETFSYRECVKLIGKAIGKPRPIISIPDSAGALFGTILGKALQDVVITQEEIGGLKADLLCTPSQPVGRTSLAEWAFQNGETLGIHYASELARRRDRTKAYEDLV